MIRTAIVAIGVALIFSLPAKAQRVDERRGQRLYLQCQACHSMRPGEPHKIGPNLAGIVEAPAASRPGYVYSRALKASGLRWDQVTLDRWLTSPAKTVPGNKMIYPGMKSAADRAALIAYLRRASR